MGSEIKFVLTLGDLDNVLERAVFCLIGVRLTRVSFNILLLVDLTSALSWSLDLCAKG